MGVAQDSGQGGFTFSPHNSQTTASSLNVPSGASMLVPSSSLHPKCPLGKSKGTKKLISPLKSLPFLEASAANSCLCFIDCYFQGN